MSPPESGVMNKARRAGLPAKVSLSIATAFLCVVGLEVAVRMLGLWQSESALLLRSVDEVASEPTIQLQRVPHPYLGWQRRPGEKARFLGARRLDSVFADGIPSEWALANSRVNRQGFLSGVEDYALLSDDDYVVGVFGGSVASALASIGGKALSEAL